MVVFFIHVNVHQFSPKLKIRPTFTDANLIFYKLKQSIKLKLSYVQQTNLELSTSLTSRAINLKEFSFCNI